MTSWLGKALFVAALVLPTPGLAQSLTFGPALSDGAVLQRGQPIEVTGSAAAGAKVSVEFAGTQADTTASKDGAWRVTLPAMASGENLALVATSGGERLELEGIRIGEVFLCSGQSNMQFSMAQTALEARERKLPIDRNIGLLSVPTATARVEQAHFSEPAKWTTAYGGSGDFSAVCLIAGRAIAQAQAVPVGLIDASMGGTPIEAWLPYEGLQQAGGMEEALAILDEFRADPAAAEARFGSQLDALWQMPPPPGQEPGRPRLGYANLFNAMIAPLGRMRMAGVIWYQGENNTRRPNARAAYQSQLEALLASWRARFGEDLPFAIVQLAPFGPLSSEPAEHNWAEVREAQRRVAEADRRAGLVVTSDVGERLDIHPPLKKPVGLRAAAVLSHLLYAAPAGTLGPRPIDARREGGEVRVRIAGGNAGLMAASWGRPGPFMLCHTAANRECRFADARLIGDSVAVEIPEGFTFDLVRYCWGAAPICNVFDGQQRPLGPFELLVEPNDANDGKAG
ncbi:sialate O-acetylesterase [Altererythrobacter sp. BO-6]|uniref:sialate O-acetylesterase n=1 Tax=Altererythrobacter sp. BO-6 TaxID=2604537 RepID=UPI0013E1CEC1|nr:sialate O-acetylesterase [Altererythrobacter sp. BO-6]QIG53521.1 sialate O-acetylesterase [Altererythrobacter sp. BO-6]